MFCLAHQVVNKTSIRDNCILWSETNNSDYPCFYFFSSYIFYTTSKHRSHTRPNISSHIKHKGHTSIQYLTMGVPHITIQRLMSIQYHLTMANDRCPTTNGHLPHFPHLYHHPVIIFRTRRSIWLSHQAATTLISKATKYGQISHFSLETLRKYYCQTNFTKC